MKKKLVRVKMLPKAVYGMNVTGKINNADGSQTNQNNFLLDNGGQPNISVSGTLKPTDRENATLEAEKGETVVTQLDQANSGGIPEFYTIGGKPHSQGGTPLNLPPDSFIFSKDRKMKVTDPDILAQFGKTVPKKGKKWFTPAELSKQYDINKYRKILADPNSDFYQIDTAKKMIENYNLKLGSLAMVQESMKGFDNGIPGIAMPYLEHAGIDPMSLFPQQGGTPQESPMPMQRYGGDNYFEGGGKVTYDPNLKVNRDSTAITPGTEIINPNLLQPRSTELTTQYDYLQDYTPTYDKEGKKVVYGANKEKHPVYKRKTDLSAQELDIRREMADIYDLPTTPQGLPDYKQIDPNIVLDKSKMPEQLRKDFYAILYEKRAIRDAEGFKRKQYYGDKEAAQKGYSEQTPLEDLNLGIRFATGVQSKQLEELAANKKDAELLSLKQYGGSITKAQDGLNVSEDQYTTGLSPAQGQRIRMNPNTGAYEVVDMSGNIIGRMNVPETASRATSSQKVPKNAVKWDMSAEGYDETAVQPGDYVKNAKGTWHKVTGYKADTTAFTGDVDPALGSLGESYGRLEQRITESPELQKALVKKYRENMAKAKPRNNLSEADLEKAKGLSDEEIIDNFLRGEKQVMAVQSKGPLEDKSDAWDKDLSNYQNAMSELGFKPMEAWETAAFQGAYIGLQNLADDKKYKKDLEDFNISRETRLGKGDEPGGGTGRSTISDIDGWFGNTTVGQAALYAPQAKELEMQEAEWNEAKKDPVVKHLANTYQEGRTPFWTQDIINNAFALKNLWGIRKFPPWNAMPGTKLPTATFMSPDQQIQNILGATRQGTQGAAAFSGPQSYAANIAAIQGNAMQQVANAIGTVQDKNVQVANQFELQRANIMNRANEKRAQLATNLHDKQAILNQQFANAKNKAWDEVRQGMVNAWTNRGKTQTMNELRDDFNVDPVTGYTYKSSGYRPIIPKNTQQNDLAARTNQLVSAIPGLTPDRAAAIAMREKGSAPSPTNYMGMDPTELGPGWPGGAPSGYQ